jgi:hypothetical protein
MYIIVTTSTYTYKLKRKDPDADPPKTCRAGYESPTLLQTNPKCLMYLYENLTWTESTMVSEAPRVRSSLVGSMLVVL